MINYFFGSKKGLLKEILDDFYRGYLELSREHLCGKEAPEKKLRSFILHAIEYIAANREPMIIVLTELPHDDREITEYKAGWAAKMMVIIRDEICTPLKEQRGMVVSPAVIGPMLISMMSSRFLFAPVIEHLNPEGLQEEFLEKYPNLVADLFLNGLNGLTDTTGEESNA